MRHLAVGELEGSLTLLCDPLMPGGTSGDPEVAGQIQGSSSATSVTVPVVTLDNDIASHQLPRPT